MISLDSKQYEYLVLHENNFFVDVFQHVHMIDNSVQMHNELIQNVLDERKCTDFKYLLIYRNSVWNVQLREYVDVLGKHHHEGDYPKEVWDIDEKEIVDEQHES